MACLLSRRVVWRPTSLTRRRAPCYAAPDSPTPRLPRAPRSSRGTLTAERSEAVSFNHTFLVHGARGNETARWLSRRGGERLAFAALVADHERRVVVVAYGPRDGRP